MNFITNVLDCLSCVPFIYNCINVRRLLAAHNITMVTHVTCVASRSRHQVTIAWEVHIKCWGVIFLLVDVSPQ
jgi:hypothetical protein